MGPSALRIAGIAESLEALGYCLVDTGNIAVPQRETLPVGAEGLRYLDPIAEVCRGLYTATTEALEAGALPITLGGGPLASGWKCGGGRRLCSLAR